jgi:PQQ-dependent catabolism-associated CXXCW motif protein
VRGIGAGVLLAALLALSAVRADEGIAEPPDYRTDNYRAPVPATLAGGRVLTTSEAAAIWRAKSGAFIDVLPRPPKPANLPAGTIWREPPRLDIPDSVWLPDTGYGRLAPATEDYLRRGLAQATAGDRSRLLVIYCQANCWMSWNAARRAIALGYTNVSWYPDGTDGWAKADLPLAEAQPLPRPEPAAEPSR